MSDGQRERRKSILSLLKDSQIGLSISNIADKLGYSRNTVSKYLKILKEEGKVLDRELGKYSIWIHKNSELYFGKNKAKGQKFALETYRFFLEYLELNHPELTSEGKEAGYHIGRNMNIKELISPEMLEFDISLMDLNNLAKYIMDLLNNTYLSIDTYTWEPPSIVNDPNIPLIILRLRDSQYIGTPINFYMLGGALEVLMNDMLKDKKSPLRIKVSIQIMSKKSKIVEFQVKIKFSEKIMKE